MSTPYQQTEENLIRMVADPNFRAVRVEEYRGHDIIPAEAVAAPTDEPYTGLVIMDENNYVVSDGLDTVENAKKFIDRWLDEGWRNVAENAVEKAADEGEQERTRLIVAEIRRRWGHFKGVQGADYIESLRQEGVNENESAARA
jgi:hypothetical protein